MSSVVNLRLFRKRKARADRQREAEANRVQHGRTRAEKLAARKEAERSTAFIEAHRLDPKERDGAS